MRLLRVAADMLELEPDPSVDPRPVTERGIPRPFAHHCRPGRHQPLVLELLLLEVE